MKIKEGFYLSPCGEHIIEVYPWNGLDNYYGVCYLTDVDKLYCGVNECYLSFIVIILSGWERLEE